MNENSTLKNQNDTIAGIIAMFLIIVMAITDVPFHLFVIVFISIFLINFIWSISKRENRKSGAYKESFKILLIMLLVSAAIGLWRTIFSSYY
ncbi:MULTISPECIES: hypothetical protein [Salimicrobium]|uniref:hypothetical protein n=1 Tax=Salimicrobium TaxID=351195 RepID=UPI000971361A|nr:MULTISPECIES: hypothetical protein [Salimicrobium]